MNTQSTMNFGSAIEHIKNGGRAARSGWNGKGMFIFLNKGNFDFSPKDGDPDGEITHIEEIKSSLFESGDTGTTTLLPNINMRAATGSTVTGWLASQTDILAEDWVIVE
jgi:hypothetical protein